MKTRRAVKVGTVVGVGILLIGVVLLAQTEEQAVRMETIIATIAELEPMTADSMPESGTFYLVSDYLKSDDGNPTPYPCNVRPEAKTFPLGDGFFLVDDVALGSIAVRSDAELDGALTVSGRQYTMASTMNDDLSPPGDEGEPDPGQTNTPAITWPVSLSDLSLVAPQDVPEVGTFFLYHDQVNGEAPAPYPQNPCPLCPVYSLGIEGLYLVDDTGVMWPQPDPAPDPGNQSMGYAAGVLWLQLTNRNGSGATLILHGTQPGRRYDILAKQALSSSSWTRVDTVSGATNQDWTALSVAIGGSGGGFYWATISDNALWLQMPANSLAVPGQMTVVLRNTMQDQQYDILSKQSLSDRTWSRETSVLGSDGNTLVTVALNGRTNLLVWARYGGDSLGIGIPDWWQLEYFGCLGIDPYDDPDGDGWSNLQEYQNGTSPIGFNTPPPPRNVMAELDSTGTNVILTWRSGGGPVDHYSISGQWLYPEVVVSANTFIYIDQPLNGDGNPYNYLYGDPWIEPDFQVRAYFTNGTYTDSAPVTVSRPTLSLKAQIVRGPMGQPYLMVESPPPNLSVIRLLWECSSGWPPSYTWFDLPASNLVNGLMPIPANAWQPYYGSSWLRLSAFTADGKFGYPATRMATADELLNLPVYSFVDARRHMKQNLEFLLRSATVSTPFGVETYFYQSGGVSSQPGSDPGLMLGRPVRFPDYECYGFHWYSDFLGFSFMDEQRPVQEHYLWRNFVFDPQEIDGEGKPTTGADYIDSANIRLLGTDPTHQFSGLASNSLPVPLAFTNTAGSWLYDHWVWYGDVANLADTGLYLDANTNLYLADGVLNRYGLPINSVQFRSAFGKQFVTLTRGGAGVTSYDFDGGRYFYANAAVPNLIVVDYYFASETPHFKLATQPYYTNGPPLPPMPGTPGFTNTNSSPLLIASFGQLFTVSGWAKMAITNGYAGKFAYLEQYFDKAYNIDTNGIVSTNEAGLLSPYGEFFPTEPGPAALVTMPDFDTGQRGTGVVQVIKLQLDVNHDGVMDTSFAGPDNTSFARPFSFWVNNDHDEPASGSNPDRDLNDWGNPPPVPPDYTYGAIRCQRNLEDFARLWVCGMPTLPADYTVQLGWSSISTGSPRIRLYWASETNGGIGYLTNATMSAQQIAQHSTPIGEISPTSILSLPVNVFSNGLTKYFLFEAGAVGSGQLTLTIIQGGTNTIAQTSAWFDFRDITDFYEQAIVTNVLQEWPDMVQTNLTSGFQVYSYAKVNPGDAKQLAVFVHGWRMGVWDWYSFSETMFKRLWWQGYQGRFAALRWPTRNANTELFPQMGFITYNRSERIAFKSGTGTAAYLNNLRNRFPDYTISGCSHSMGGIVAMQTLKQLAAAGQQPVDNWVLMQAAVPAQCFDTNAPNFQMFLDGEAVVPTPDVYRNYAAGITNALRPGGKIANFFNPDDFALWTWQLNQAFYVANLLGNGVTTMKPNAFFGYSTDGANSVLSTNVWNQSFYAVIYGGYYGNGPARAITDPLELMPFVARPRGLAVGASPNVHGQIQGQQLNLEVQLGFGAGEDDHSGEFNRNIQEPPVWPFYSQLKTNLFPQQ